MCSDLDQASEGVGGQPTKRALAIRAHVPGWVVVAHDATTGLLAIALLIAATLKLQALLRGGAIDTAVRVASASVIICAQLVLACWLLTGVAPIWCRRITITILTIFVTLTGYKLVTGATDCGCFESVRVSPAFTFSFDAVALVGILLLGRKSSAK